MTLQNSRRTGLLRLRHLMEHTEAVGEEMAEERDRFARLAQDDAAPRVVSSFNLFQTPETLAAELVSRAGITDATRVLEPSAGLGRIYRAIRAQSTLCPVTLVENAPQCCAELYRQTEGSESRLIQGDFLEQTTEQLGEFDAVVMNPPFKQGRDVKHIRHAAGMLAPGGILVSLCAAGPRQRRAFENLDGWTWEDLPAGQFKSEGTNVAVAIVIFENPQN